MAIDFVNGGSSGPVPGRTPSSSAPDAAADLHDAALFQGAIDAQVLLEALAMASDGGAQTGLNDTTATASRPASSSRRGHGQDDLDPRTDKDRRSDRDAVEGLPAALWWSPAILQPIDRHVRAAGDGAETPADSTATAPAGHDDGQLMPEPPHDLKPLGRPGDLGATADAGASDVAVMRLADESTAPPTAPLTAAAGAPSLKAAILRAIRSQGAAGDPLPVASTERVDPQPKSEAPPTPALTREMVRGAAQDKTTPASSAAPPIAQRPAAAAPLTATAEARPQARGFTADSGSSSDSSRDRAALRSSDPAGALHSRNSMVPLSPASFQGAVTSALAAAMPNGTATTARADEASVGAPVVQSMLMQYRAGGGTAVVQLDPEFLGGVKISLTVADGQVTASLQAEKPDVRAWLEANQSTLRQGLAGQGLTLEQLSVTAPDHRDEWTPPDRERRQQQHEPPPQPRRRVRDDEAGAFEVVV